MGDVRFQNNTALFSIRQSSLTMIKRLFALLTWALLNSCNLPTSIPPSSTIIGIYKLTEYNTVDKTDTSPTGFVTISAVDDQHVNLTAEGTSDSSIITHTYQNIAVTSLGRNYMGEEFYSLVYDTNQIGIINSDDRGHYIILTPKPTILLIAEIALLDHLE